MEKHLLEEFVSYKLTSYEIAQAVGKSQTTVRYWLNKHGISLYKTRNRGGGESFTCSRCRMIGTGDDFYWSKGKRGGYCKACHNKQTVDRAREFKQACVDYKGGSCSGCGYDECLAALEFHHVDPTKKDFAIGGRSIHCLTDVIRAELDKCVLVCCRCHREIHAGVREIGTRDGS